MPDNKPNDIDAWRKSLPPDPRQESTGGKPKSQGKPTMEVAHWFWGAVLFLLPTILLWILHQAGYYPRPCRYYGAWVAIGALMYGMVFCAVQLSG